MPADDTKTTKKPARTTNASPKAPQGFSAEERAAAQQRVQELKAGKENGESAVLAAIAAMTPPDRVLAERLHAIITASAPSLAPKTWYGMPAYANKDGKIVCFFQPAQKFKTRYATFSFSDGAHLDDGTLWPVAYALTELTAAAEARIVALVKRALS